MKRKLFINNISVSIHNSIANEQNEINYKLFDKTYYVKHTKLKYVFVASLASDIFPCNCSQMQTEL